MTTLLWILFCDIFINVIMLVGSATLVFQEATPKKLLLPRFVLDAGKTSQQRAIPQTPRFREQAGQ